MGEAYFYQLSRQPLDQALPRLVERALGRGWRVAVRGRDDRQMQHLDQALWLGDDDGFLPHGLAGGPHDAQQPVLLTISAAAANGATCVMAVHGAEVGPDEVRTLDRVCVIFDGGDPAALETARAQWRTLTAAGCGAQYWSDDGGGWQKKAERPAGEG